MQCILHAHLWPRRTVAQTMAIADANVPCAAGVMVHKVDCCMLDLVDYHSGGEPIPKLTRRRSQQLSKQRSKHLPDDIAFGQTGPLSTASSLGSPVVATPATSPIPESKSVHEGVADDAAPAQTIAAQRKNVSRML